jgi:hypothetical protein
MQRSWVIETLRVAGVIGADSRRQSLVVDQRSDRLAKLWVVASGTPRPSRAVRHSLPKLFGSRSVPAVDGKITDR